MFTPLAYLALFGWPLVVILLFAILPHRKAATIAVVGAWLILPPYSIDFPGLPDYGKNVAAAVGMLLATLIFAPDRLLAFRPRWFDLPMVLFCFSASASSISNGLGFYDATSELEKHIFSWGLPYLLARIYFGTPEDFRGLVVGVAFGGLAYVLPCLYESRMSPTLLQDIYGYAQLMGMRWGGFRPHVFFWTGLECGMWMTAASLSAWWLWRCGTLRRLGPFPFGLAIPILLLTTVICRSTGALLLLLAGILLLWVSSRLRTRLLLVGLLLVGPVYVGVRLPQLWSGQQAVDLANSLFGPDRAQSLEFRFQSERLLADKALQRPFLGWGGFGRNIVYFSEDGGGMNVPPDGLWILMMGSRGYFGMTLVYLVFALPAALFVRRFPARSWGDPQVAAASLAAGLLGLYIVDCLLNAFVNIIYISMAGGLIGLDPRQMRLPGAPGREAQAAGRRRAAGRRPSLAPRGVATAASGRALLADRCRTLGRSFKLEGRLDEADAAWRQALELLAALIEADPGADEPRRRWCDCANDLAWLRANHPDPARRDPNSAVSLARRSVDEYPDVATYRNTLGAALYRAGDPREAIDALERARDLGGGTAFDEVFLAMARARAGELEAARQALARAMLQSERDYPGHPELSALCDEAQSLIAGAAPAAVP